MKENKKIHDKIFILEINGKGMDKEEYKKLLKEIAKIFMKRWGYD